MDKKNNSYELAFKKVPGCPNISMVILTDGRVSNGNIKGGTFQKPFYLYLSSMKEIETLDPNVRERMEAIDEIVKASADEHNFTELLDSTNEIIKAVQQNSGNIKKREGVPAFYATKNEFVFSKSLKEQTEKLSKEQAWFKEPEYPVRYVEDIGRDENFPNMHAFEISSESRKKDVLVYDPDNKGEQGRSNSSSEAERIVNTSAKNQGADRILHSGNTNMSSVLHELDEFATDLPHEAVYVCQKGTQKAIVGSASLSKFVRNGPENQRT